MKVVVTANKLNVRKNPVIDFAKKSNIVGVILKDSIHESTEQHENILGVWHKIDGGWVNDKWVSMPISSHWWYEKLKIDDLRKIIEPFSSQNNVTVAVLDTGITTNLSSETFNIIGKKNFTNNTNNVIDIQSGHGTLCMSLIGASDKVFGSINPNVKIFIAKIFTDELGTNHDIIADAINTLSNPDNNLKIDILSISGGVPVLSSISPIIKAIDYANQQSVIVSAAIGNKLQTKSGYYPARHPDAFSIGALDENFEFSTKLNPIVEKIDYLLPGENIQSLNFLQSKEEFDGTSHACAIMTGILSLLIALKKEKQLSWKTDDLRQFLNSSCDKIVATKNNYTYNRINPDLLIQNIKKILS